MTLKSDDADRWLPHVRVSCTCFLHVFLARAMAAVRGVRHDANRHDLLVNPPETSLTSGPEPAVPLEAAPRDRILPILLFVSLVVHATIILPSLIGPPHAPPTPPKEIPVEIVQLPPPPKPAPPKPAAKAPAPKPPAAKPPEPKPAPKKSPEPAPKPPQKPMPEAGEQKFKDLLGAMPAIALPGAAADGTESVSYAQLVLSQVAKAKKQGRYRGVPGAASVTFTLDDSGGVANVAIVRPSGQQSLDDEAIAMIKRGAPYPVPPPGARRNFTITLRFEPLI